MTEKYILEDNVILQAKAKDWQDAVYMSASMLVKSGRIKPGYIDAIFKTVEKFGPYFVIAPELVLAHSRPDENVLETGLSLLTLKEPVVVSEDTGPIYIVLTLAAVDSDSHQDMLKRLSFYLMEPGKIDYIKRARDVHTLANDMNNFVVE